VIELQIDNEIHKFNGTTIGKKNRLTAATTSTCAQSSGPEDIYLVSIVEDGILTVRVSASVSTFDSVLYARKGNCNPGATEFCADRTAPDHSLNGGEVLSFPVKNGEVWHVMVDGFADTAEGTGNYLMSLTLRSGTHKDSVVEVGFEPGSMMTMYGDTSGSMAKVMSTVCGGPAGEIIYRVEDPTEMAIPTQFKFEASPTGPNLGSTDLVIYAIPLSTTPEGLVSAFDCHNDQGGGGPESVNTTTAQLPAYVIVDAVTDGPYELFMTPIQ
jgi:hypothetical protein